MKRLFALIIITVLFVSIFTSCSGGKNETLTVWCSEKDKELITSMVDSFMQTKPRIKGINIEVCEDDDAWKTFSGGVSADVICIPHDQLGAFVEENYLLEITDAKYTDAISGNTAPSIKAGQIDGKQYGFPSSFETHMLFYDRLYVTDQAVNNLEDILSLDLPDDVCHFGMDIGNAYYSANWFFTFGCSLFGESGEDKDFCDFDSAGGVAAMTYVINNSGKFGNFGGDSAVDLFREHKLAAYISGPWDAGSITEALKGNYGCARLPSVEGMNMKSFAGYKLYCVNADTKNKTVSMDLAAWLTNTENQKQRFKKRNLIPVAEQLSEDADVAASTTAKALMAQGPYAIAMPSIPEMGNFWAPTGEFTLACFNGEIKIGELQPKLSELAIKIKSGGN